MREGRLRAAFSFWQDSGTGARKRAGVTTVTKPVVLAALVLAAFVFLYPHVRDRLPETLRYEPSSATQSSSQLSPSEFDQIDSYFTPARLGSFAGEPATRTDASVEGVDLECWYYGVAGERGAYQICFENGKLSTKVRFGQ
jgi:hypothetical protein